MAYGQSEVTLVAEGGGGSPKRFLMANRRFGRCDEFARFRAAVFYIRGTGQAHEAEDSAAGPYRGSNALGRVGGATWHTNAEKFPYFRFDWQRPANLPL